MYRVSSLVAAGLAALRLVNAQQAIAAITGAAGGNNGDCGGCYVGADVAGIAFGSTTLVATATNQVIVMPGMNSTFTTTSLIFNQGQFTFAPTGIVGAPGGAAAATPFGIGSSTFEVNGVTLTSPTAYNVFTAYSVTSYVSVNGGCSIAAGTPITLPTAFSVAIPEGVDYASFALEAERSFVSIVGLPTCSAGGVSLTPTSLIPQATTTVSATTTARATLTPQPAIAGSTTKNTNGPTGPTTITDSSAAVLVNGTGTVFVPNASGGSSRTIAIAQGSSTKFIVIAGASRATGSFWAGAAALLMGLVA